MNPAETSWDSDALIDAPQEAPTTPGAAFLRADLHVHTHLDTDTDPEPDLSAYIKAAVERGIDVMAITDHNSIAFVRDAIKAAKGQPLVIMPGIEISTNDGHLLALFDPENVEALESFATTENLKLQTLSPTEKCSDRSILDLVAEIDAKGGLAIPAHVDISSGICNKLGQNGLVKLLCSPGLAGLEFAKTEALESWFRETDEDPARRAAWQARQKDPVLKDRGLARLMSSDAHTPDKVGLDRGSRTLTRLRLDDPNFAALRIAIQLNPKARCKAEAILPAAYPRVVSANFEGGFLDGVSMSFTPNLNCLIGGRGSGKSTALLSIRAALGATLSPDDDPDDSDRMPSKTTVVFIDSSGSERVAVRERGGSPADENGAPVRLRMADLGQDESGRLARGYTDDPEILLRFLDQFIVRYEFDEAETELLAQLEENGAEISRTAGVTTQIKQYAEEESRHESALKAAQENRVVEIAQWANRLAAQKPLLEELDARLAKAVAATSSEPVADLEALASTYKVDLTAPPASDFILGEDGLKQRLAELDAKRQEIVSKADADVATAASQVRSSLEAWRGRQVELEERLATRKAELEQQGLKVQADAIVAIANRLNTVKTQLATLRKKAQDHETAIKARAELLVTLEANREKLYRTREATLKRIAEQANTYSDGLTVRVFYERNGVDQVWTDWLTRKFSFRQPRVGRLAQLIGPSEFAQKLRTDHEGLLSLKDLGGAEFFTKEMLEGVSTWTAAFELDIMRREDRPCIEVQRDGDAQRRSFDHLSTGQQRSVLLGLLLCAKRSEPLVLDQPEDHLDGQYIASAVVTHLEAAKELRQVLMATHSANLVVLGDAELVIPMRVERGRGRPYAIGAVDRPDTRDEVCALLEGGVQAFKKRGERYGFKFSEVPGRS
jgi:hypothetical protein